MLIWSGFNCPTVTLNSVINVIYAIRVFIPVTKPSSNAGESSCAVLIFLWSGFGGFDGLLEVLNSLLKVI